MRTILLSIAFSLRMFYVHAQNLVPNPSFEQYNNCPYIINTPFGSGFPIAYSPSYDSFPTALYWVSPIDTSTPDYYNTCDTIPGGFGSVPSNNCGYQEPHSGNAYTGVFMYFHDPPESDYREYIEAKLLAPLIAGHQYTVSFYVSITEGYNPGNIEPYNKGVVSVDKIGAYLSNIMIDSTAPGLNGHISLTPSIESAPGWCITDTGNWTKITGVYTAHGGEQWITLGRFEDGLPETFVVLTNPQDTATYAYCYMYLDDVCVTDMTGQSHDTTICSAAFPTTLSGINAPGTYLWNTGDTTATITAAAPGTYWRITTGDCFYFADTIHLLQSPSIFLGKDTIICAQAPLALSAPQTDTVRYRWNTGDTTCCISVSSSGTYTLSVYNNCGVTTDSISVIAFSPCDTCVWAPTAFTPNNDGKNDVFKVAVRCPLLYYRIHIFNRWGQEVFFASNADDCWNGSFEGITQTGVFFYYIQYQTALPGATRQMIKGDVTVIR
jgi:gliding motility-associated-like protein